MANLIILEGLSRTGKSTICKILGERHNTATISHEIKMPNYVKNLPDFYHGMHLTFSHLIKQFPNETFILDRSFLSELVYSKFFKRKTYETEGNLIEDLLFNNNFLVVYLSNTYSNYINRKPKESNIYEEKDFIKQKDLFDWFFSKYQDLRSSDEWKSRFIEIDSATNNIYETIEIIEDALSRNNIIKQVTT